MPLALIAGFALLWYALHELAPLKPYPDVTRYMLPLAPLLAILATSFFYGLFKRRNFRAIIAAVVVVAAAIPALWTSVRINGGGQDPRAVVPQILAATGARIATDRYADYRRLRANWRGRHTWTGIATTATGAMRRRGQGVAASRQAIIED